MEKEFSYLVSWEVNGFRDGLLFSPSELDLMHKFVKHILARGLVPDIRVNPF